jgi:mannonate dehydratase
MKVAVGLKPAEQIYDPTYLQFLRQIGVTHILGFKYDESVLPSAKDGYWSYEDLSRLANHFKDNGLILEGIENFLPVHWYKVLMDLPGREAQMDNLKRTITNMGKAGIPIMGYNFSAGGVIGRFSAPVGRGGTYSVSFDPEGHPFEDAPIPRSMAWGQVVDPDATGVYPPISREEMKDRLYRFLDEMLPVCADAGVALAAHPEDPPIPYMRHAGRVLITPEDYEEMFRRFPTPYCTAEFCQGTFTEMGVDVYDTIRRFASANRISYVHLRNVHGVVPKYDEMLIDDGDINMAKAMKAYHDGGYTGAFIPDHYPELAGISTPHATVAFAIGYVRALMKALDIPIYGTDYVD